MNVSINESCIACGMCESICSDVFKVEEIAKVCDSAVSENEECVKTAAESCPVSAIEIE